MSSIQTLEIIEGPEGEVGGTKYRFGDMYFELDDLFRKVTLILDDHPEKGYQTYDPESGEYGIKECTPAFVNMVYEILEVMQRYFEYFARLDKAVSKGLWVHLVHHLKDRVVFPHRKSDSGLPICSHSGAFNQRFESIMEAINSALTAPLSRTERVLWPEEGEDHDRCSGVAGFRTGLNPYQQYLCNGAPGFAVPQSDRVFPHNTERRGTKIAEQLLPLGAVNIVQAHIGQLQDAAYELAQENPATAEDVMERYERNQLDVGRTYDLRDLYGQSVRIEHMVPHPESLMSPPVPPFVNVTEEGRRLRTLEEMDQATGDYEGEALPEHPGGDNLFHMMRVTTYGDDSVEPEYSEFQEMFTDYTFPGAE